MHAPHQHHHHGGSHGLQVMEDANVIKIKVIAAEDLYVDESKEALRVVHGVPPPPILRLACPILMLIVAMSMIPRRPIGRVSNPQDDQAAETQEALLRGVQPPPRWRQHLHTQWRAVQVWQPHHRRQRHGLSLLPPSSLDPSPSSSCIAMLTSSRLFVGRAEGSAGACA